MGIIDAPADCIAFDDLDTHDDGDGNGLLGDDLLGEGRIGVS